MAELERLDATPFALTQDEKGRCMASQLGEFSGQCTQEFRIGFFFDGTNNNKDRREALAHPLRISRGCRIDFGSLGFPLGVLALQIFQACLLPALPDLLVGGAGWFEPST